MRIHAHGPAVLLVALWLGGCATLFQVGPSPERIAERGLAALEARDYDAAIADLGWVSTNFPERPAGRYALLALAAAELDPANPAGRPDVGAELLANFRASTDNPSWTMPVANTLRGLVLELRDTSEQARGAERAALEAEERAHGAAREARQARAEMTALGNRVAELERQLAQSRRQHAQTREELQRVRRTIAN